MTHDISKNRNYSVYRRLGNKHRYIMVIKTFSFRTKAEVMTRVGCSRVWHFIRVCTVCPDEKEAIRDEVA